MGDWPVCLVIVTATSGTVIDVEERGWATTYAELMRTPGVWKLCDKQGNTLLAVQVHPGDQPFFTARHIGKMGSGGSNEIIAFGIGKKDPAGTRTVVWKLPDGSVCGGDDVDDLGVHLVERLGPRATT